MHWHGYPVSANVSLLFPDLPYDQRFRAAAAAGYDRVETWWPFPVADPGRDELDRLLRVIDDAGVRLTGLNVFAGDMPAGERGIACAPGRAAELEQGLGSLLHLARATGCRGFNLLHGRLEDGLAPEVQRRAAVAAYRLAADAVAEVDGTILVEPLARGLNGAYPLETPEDVAALIDEVASPRLRLLLDTFHLGRNGVDLVDTVTTWGDRIGHVQLADSPDRGAPGTGDLDFAALGLALRDAGYTGTVAAEYRPEAGPAPEPTWATPG